MTRALLAILPFALGVTMSGTAMLALARLLVRPQWKAPAVAFVLAGSAAVGVLCGTSFAIVHATGTVSRRTQAVITTLLGVAMLLFAGRAWWRRRHGSRLGMRPHVASSHPIHAAALGALLIGVNAKNIALILSAAAVADAFQLRAVEVAIVAAAFALVGVLGILVPLVLRWAAAPWLQATFSRVDAIVVRGARFAIAAMLVIATMLIATGIGTLSRT